MPFAQYCKRKRKSLPNNGSTVAENEKCSDAHDVDKRQLACRCDTHLTKNAPTLTNENKPFENHGCFVEHDGKWRWGPTQNNIANYIRTSFFIATDATRPASTKCNLWQKWTVRRHMMRKTDDVSKNKKHHFPPLSRKKTCTFKTRQ